ncbi:uncharacterized protein [Typha angustifolia]|uniref:uncharacterized protein n=1 Tax=Typha angustifolia TaxID=59011 RepID=UPI003C2F4074
MPGVMEVKSSSKPRSAPPPVRLRAVTTRSRVPSSVVSRKKKETIKNDRKVTVRSPESGLNVSGDGLSSSGSSCGRSMSKRRPNRAKPVKVAPEGIDLGLVSPSPALVKKRCAWITPNSEPIYISFHDEEWGIPVHDDEKLFELLILSQALSELSWPMILSKRDMFRMLFDDFNHSSVANFTEKKILLLSSSGRTLLSEQKIRAVVENAKQIHKVIEEFGSFSNYCWNFVNHKPIVNGFRYARQVPAKTPKAEAFSKDLMQRGFRCVGPTIIYSFMQAAGIINDHLLSCFRFDDCNRKQTDESRKDIESLSLTKRIIQTCSLQD